MKTALRTRILTQNKKKREFFLFFYLSIGLFKKHRERINKYFNNLNKFKIQFVTINIEQILRKNNMS